MTEFCSLSDKGPMIEKAMGNVLAFNDCEELYDGLFSDLESLENAEKNLVDKLMEVKKAHLATRAEETLLKMAAVGNFEEIEVRGNDFLKSIGIILECISGSSD